MQSSKRSSLKTHIFAQAFCIIAGISYGALWPIHLLIGPFGIGLLSFANAAFWLALTNLVWVMAKKRDVMGALALFSGSMILGLAIAIGVAANSLLFKPICALQVKPGDLSQYQSP